MDPDPDGQGDELGKTIAELGALVGTPLAFNAPDMTPLASMPHAGPLDGSRLALLMGKPVADPVRRRLAGRSGIFTGTFPQRIAPFPGLELGRVHLPVRDAKGALVGHIWAIDGDEEIAEGDWRRLQHAAAHALLGVVPAPATPSRYASLERFTASHRAFRVFSVEVRPGAVIDAEGAVSFSGPDRLLRHVSARAHGAQWTIASDSAGQEVLVAGGAPEALGAAALEAALLESVRSANVEVRALGEITVFASPTLFTSYEVGDHLEAVHAVARAMMTSDSRVVFAEDLPAYELLVELGRIAPISRLEVPHAIQLLAETDRGLTVARTAKRFLDNGGNAGRTATELGIHRGTLYYRISRIEEQTGFDLERGDHRMALHLGLVAAQIAGLLD